MQPIDVKDWKLHHHFLSTMFHLLSFSPQNARELFYGKIEIIKMTTKYGSPAVGSSEENMFDEYI